MVPYRGPPLPDLLANQIDLAIPNAAKHGALSSPDGSVSVSWHRNEGDAVAVMAIIWRELGGPPIEAPVRSGCGSSLIRDLIPHQLGSAVDLTFPSDGTYCKIEFLSKGAPKLPKKNALRKATMDYDALSTSIREFFKKLRLTARREIENAVRETNAKRKLTGTTLPARAVVTVAGLDLKFEVAGDIELA
jgi:hypothetical protein